jgi:beta-mannosidase
MISGLEDTKDKTVDVFITSDLAAAGQGTVEWNITDLQGTPLDSGKLDAAIPARASQKIKTLILDPLCQQHGENNLMVWLKLSVAGCPVSQNLVTFGRPKELELVDPQLTTTITQTKNSFQVKLTAEKPALWAWLNLSAVDARYSDNFVHLNAGGSVEITVTPARPMSADEFQKALAVRSLYNTYSHAG